MPNSPPFLSHLNVGVESSGTEGFNGWVGQLPGIGVAGVTHGMEGTHGGVVWSAVDT